MVYGFKLFPNMKDGWDEVVRDCANAAIECQILLGQDLKQEIFQHFESDQKCGLILFWLHKVHVFLESH